MHVNHNKYQSDAYKIAHVESYFIIGKKAYKLVNQYKSIGLYILLTFAN